MAESKSDWWAIERKFLHSHKPLISFTRSHAVESLIPTIPFSDWSARSSPSDESPKAAFKCSASSSIISCLGFSSISLMSYLYEISPKKKEKKCKPLHKSPSLWLSFQPKVSILGKRLRNLLTVYDEQQQETGMNWWYHIILNRTRNQPSAQNLSLIIFNVVD